MRMILLKIIPRFVKKKNSFHLRNNKNKFDAVYHLIKGSHEKEERPLKQKRNLTLTTTTETWHSGEHLVFSTCGYLNELLVVTSTHDQFAELKTEMLNWNAKKFESVEITIRNFVTETR